MAITITTNITWDQAAWEKLAYFSLRPELYFDPVADVKGEHLTAEGSPSVSFNIVADLAVASAALNESTDVTPAALSDSTVTVTLAEYGNVVQTTALARGTSMIPIDPVVANVVGFNAGISIDTVVQSVLVAGSNVRYSTGSTTTGPTIGRSSVSPASLLSATDVRYVVAKLRGAYVVPTSGGLFTGFIHPDTSVDLQAATDLAGWRAPHAYSAPDAIWSGEIGAFQGVRFIETPRGPIFADAGSSTTLTDVYASIFCGKQALAKAYSKMDGNGPTPRLSPAPVTDRLRRFTGMGWYWLGGYNRFREAALYRVESASSIGVNA
jgi:N4-gp56 family major capsid protein